MSVEVDCYRLRSRNDVLEKSGSIAPGGSGIISYLRDTRLVIFCDHGNSTGTVCIDGKHPGSRISAVLYDGEDDEGRPIDPGPGKRIKITGNQELSIFSMRGPKKQVLICLDSEDDFGQTPIDSPENSNILVPV